MKIRRLLYPLALLYGGISSLRRYLYKKRICSSYIPPIPAICVGNLKVGGTGKTPHTEYLIRILHEDWELALLSRGYGRETKGTLIAMPRKGRSLTASVFGDEPAQIGNKFQDIAVAVSENRAMGIYKLIQKNPSLEVVILDDAYQHLGVNPGIKLLLTEYSDPYYKDYPMPAGNLREFAKESSYADIIIVTKSPETLSEEQSQLFLAKLKPKSFQHCFFSTLRYRGLCPVNKRAREAKPARGSFIILVTGIANPNPLLFYLSEQFDRIKHFKYNDHHIFTPKNIEQIMAFEEKNKGAMVITTEKDWQRLQTGAGKKIISLLPVFTVEIEVAFLFNEENKFNEIIKSYVRENSKDCLIS